MPPASFFHPGGTPLRHRGHQALPGRRWRLRRPVPLHAADPAQTSPSIRSTTSTCSTITWRPWKPSCAGMACTCPTRPSLRSTGDRSSPSSRRSPGRGGVRPSRSCWRPRRATGATRWRFYRRFAGANRRPPGRETSRTLAGRKAAGESGSSGSGHRSRGTQLLNSFGIGTETLDCLVERNELRRGLYSPGRHIPIRIESELPAPPDVYYVLAWNFRDEILRRKPRIDRSRSRVSTSRSNPRDRPP